MELFKLTSFKVKASAQKKKKLTFHSAHHINKATQVVWVYVYMLFNNVYVNTANDLITQRNEAPGKLDCTQFTGFLIQHFCSTYQLNVSN